MSNLNAILDKSFLQGASRNILKLKARKYRLIITDTLFYEIISSEKHTELCLNRLKLLAGTGCLFIEDLGYLLQIEANTGSVAESPSEYLQSEQDVDKILELYDAYPDHLNQAGIRRRDRDTQRVARSMLWQVDRWRTRGLHTIMAQMGDVEDRETTIDIMRIACSEEGMWFLYENYTNTPKVRLDPSSFTPQSMTYTWLQVIIYYTIKLLRYNGKSGLDIQSGEVSKWLMNEISDMEYVTLALLEGQLLSKDNGMILAYSILSEFREEISPIPALQKG